MKIFSSSDDALLVRAKRQILSRAFCYRNIGGSKFSSSEIELRNRVTQNNVTLRASNWKFFIEKLLSNY